jgi:PAN domain
VPKKTKAIPDDRAEWSFGDALYWHFFIYGTRPQGDPDDPVGRTWDPKEAANASGVTVRGFWNWVDDRHYPYDTKTVEKALFGDSKAFASARQELRRLLQESRQRQREAGSASGPINLPAVVTGQAVTVYTTPFEAAEVDGPVSEADFRGLAPWLAENFGKTGWNPLKDDALTDERPIQGRLPGGSPPAAQALRGNRKVITVALAGVLILIASYGTKRFFDYSNTGTVSGQTPDQGPKPPSEPPKNEPPKNELPKETKGPTPEEQRAADERRKQEERLAALEKKANAEAAAVKAKKEADARAVNIKLKALAQNEADDLCKKQLEGISVPGFTLKCDTLIPFGKLLAKAGVSQTASSLGECANRCRKESDCVAFSFDAGAHIGAASCYLTGSIPAQNPGKNWISGIRK